jgi:DNA end-binding protein Ku
VLATHGLFEQAVRCCDEQTACALDDQSTRYFYMATTRKKKKRSTSRSRFRASWRGQLRFGLIAFEVQAVNAEIKENAEVHFHLLHEPDHQRIHYAKMCPKHGEVPNDEIVEGYEYAKGKYVEFDKEELDTLRTEKEKALTIDAFVSADDIDPIYFDGRMYYLIPFGTGANEPYALIEAAMAKHKRWGVGQVVFSGREQLAVVRPLDGVLTMAMLNYDAEIRKPADIKKEFTRAHTTSRKLYLAEELVRKWENGKFDFADYKDRYRQKVRQAIESKEKGQEISAPEEDEPEVINLMDALQRSVGAVKYRTRSSGYRKSGHGRKAHKRSHGARRRRA